MNCWSRNRIEQAMMDGEIYHLYRHLEDCKDCSELYEQLLREQEMLSGALFMERLPESFTGDVMAALEGVSMESTNDDVALEGVSMESTNDDAALKAVQKRVRSLWRRIGIAAAVLLLVCSVALYAQPTVAEFVRSLFASNAGVDIGLWEAQKMGIVQDPHVKVTDQGYTLEINEVVADGARIVLAVKMTNPEGKPVNGPDSGVLDWRGLTIKDKNGKEVAELKTLGGAENIDKLTYILTQPVTTDKLVVEGKFDRLISWSGKSDIPGRWEFRFELDMKRANELTLVEPLNEQYTTPEGLHIEMERLVRTPSGVRLELNTSLSEEAAKRSPGDLQKQQLLMYHFEDEHGQEISSVNARGAHINNLIAESSSIDEKTGRIHRTYNFNYLPYDRQKVRFVLDGYSIPIRSEAAVTFDPTALAAKSAIWKDQGDTLKLLDMNIDLDPNKGRNDRSRGQVGLIHLQGRFTNMFRNDQWVAHDEHGHSYAVSYRGSGNYSLEKGLEISGDPGFIVEGMTKLPKQVTLVRKVTDKQYSQVDWSFDLPKGKRLEGVPDSDSDKLHK